MAVGHATLGAATRSHFPTTPKLFRFFPIPDSRFPIPENCQLSFYPLN
ncbi:hypothetical protein [Moorena producens]|nr:hypothetical protein [Moorena producens]